MTEDTNKNVSETSPKEKKPWQFKTGNPGGPGRPRGSVSIKTMIKEHLEDNPDKLAELVNYYINDRRMRELLWKMLDGAPKQQQEISGTGLPVLVKLIRDDGSSSSTGT